ncbi:transcription factor IIIB 60 kDa subunit isoform X2 [Aristolochia californica]|uniref:transcription factor IIIB 60 kDa subunit isoform X2 n=1 Tax=Aristolochia californica TaxID=171875 RepID=UPI0035E0A5F8
MPWCKHCAKACATVRDTDNGYVCCAGCGRVIDQDIYSTDVTFIKGAGGQSQMAGSFIRSILSDYSASHERTLMKGKDEIYDLVTSLCVSGGDSIVNPAHAFYTIAVERNFTRGRRTSHVAAACLYIACRQSSKPYLLIDFSEYLQINVYVLGAVFLQLCKLLRLEEHPIVQKPIDPSLFIDRFTERLLGKKNFAVSRTALCIVASMKRDWMQTGRKPSGLCGAALYISALSHGLQYSKSDVVSVVHVCEATLTKRLIEFENTESGSLTIEDFISKANELEKENPSKQPTFVGSKTSARMEVLCEHKDKGATHFAHGLCKVCYDDFIEISGGLQGGAEPPAFQRAERQRMAKEAAEERAKEDNLSVGEICHRQNDKEAAHSSRTIPHKVKERVLDSTDCENIGASTGQKVVEEELTADMSQKGADESESLSDIDDVEVDGYLHSEEEKHFKKIIWEEMNKEYLEEQAAKEAAAAAAKEAYEANFKNCSEDVLAAQELAAAASAAVAKSRKERQRKRAEEAKNAAPAQTAAEAARKMLTKKKLSSKVNLDVLEKLFDDDTTNSEKTKKQRIDSTDISKEYNTGDKELESEAAEDYYYGTEDATVVDYVDYTYNEDQDDTGYGYEEYTTEY